MCFRVADGFSRQPHWWHGVLRSMDNIEHVYCKSATPTVAAAAVTVTSPMTAITTTTTVSMTGIAVPTALPIDSVLPPSSSPAATSPSPPPPQPPPPPQASSPSPPAVEPPTCASSTTSPGDPPQFGEDVVPELPLDDEDDDADGLAGDGEANGNDGDQQEDEEEQEDEYDEQDDEGDDKDDPEENNRTSDDDETSDNRTMAFGEWKQMQSMLLLHLDLIQEQCDQILTKDKVIIKLKDENELLRHQLDQANKRLAVTLLQLQQLGQPIPLELKQQLEPPPKAEGTVSPLTIRSQMENGRMKSVVLKHSAAAASSYQSPPSSSSVSSTVLDTALGPEPSSSSPLRNPEVSSTVSLIKEEPMEDGSPLSVLSDGEQMGSMAAYYADVEIKSENNEIDGEICLNYSKSDDEESPATPSSYGEPEDEDEDEQQQQQQQLQHQDQQQHEVEEREDEEDDDLQDMERNPYGDDQYEDDGATLDQEQFATMDAPVVQDGLEYYAPLDAGVATDGIAYIYDGHLPMMRTDCEGNYIQHEGYYDQQMKDEEDPEETGGDMEMDEQQYAGEMMDEAHQQEQQPEVILINDDNEPTVGDMDPNGELLDGNAGNGDVDGVDAAEEGEGVAEEQQDTDLKEEFGRDGGGSNSGSASFNPHCGTSGGNSSDCSFLNQQRQLQQQLHQQLVQQHQQQLQQQRQQQQQQHHQQQQLQAAHRSGCKPATTGYMVTRKQYISCNWKDDAMANELEQLLTNGAAELEIPSWSVIEDDSSNVSSPSSDDVPLAEEVRSRENISDEAYLKRHTKLEIDERRRKKWDVQRIREQKNIERLKKRQLKEPSTEQEAPKSISTFYPTVDTLKQIIITDDVPVQAFGELIPLLPTSGFSLPWHQNKYEPMASSACSTSLTMSACFANPPAPSLLLGASSDRGEHHHHHLHAHSQQQQGLLSIQQQHQQGGEYESKTKFLHRLAPSLQQSTQKQRFTKRIKKEL
ncbi:uncharacterized protein LOC126572467 [Anopheles aquasalis]|uniref:uncharacterized protein LOC126572467 n=1 Tax=Anopheles aquasalis TaxID=42839 RepID=UPI00215AF3B0|nr:uncharacterized protein LOC126572467 [Anopheles aquasalis]